MAKCRIGVSATISMGTATDMVKLSFMGTNVAAAKDMATTAAADTLTNLD
jgi:hypothetical protein